MKEVTRREHLQWCKDRALKFCDAGNVQDAFASMASDLGKHPETEGHMAIGMGMTLLVAGHLSTVPKMRKFIEDFN